MKSVFITGTDTGVGKTSFAVALIKSLNATGYQTLGIKPIASGCKMSLNGQCVNADARALQKVSSISASYETGNPIALMQPIAPNLAAMFSGIELTADNVSIKLLNCVNNSADINIIEGIGGWSVPINNQQLLADVICDLNIPVIMVVGRRLGCLNHAILTSHAIIQQGAPMLGWIANCLDPTLPAIEEHIKTLTNWIKAPCLGVLPYNFQGNKLLLDISQIMLGLSQYARITRCK